MKNLWVGDNIFCPKCCPTWSQSPLSLFLFRLALRAIHLPQRGRFWAELSTLARAKTFPLGGRCRQGRRMREIIRMRTQGKADEGERTARGGETSVAQKTVDFIPILSQFCPTFVPVLSHFCPTFFPLLSFPLPSRLRRATFPKGEGYGCAQAKTFPLGGRCRQGRRMREIIGMRTQGKTDEGDNTDEEKNQNPADTGRIGGAGFCYSFVLLAR